MSNNQLWSELARSLQTDDHPGACFLHQHQAAARLEFEDRPIYELYPIRQQSSEDDWEGLLALSTGCNMVRVHLMYIKPEFRNTATIQRMFKRIASFGKFYYYANVVFYCPLVTGNASQHHFFYNISHAHTDIEIATSVPVRCYWVTRSSFEAVIK